MPEQRSPGVHVDEIRTKPIEGVATSSLGIVGPTERGPSEVRLVTSWAEFERLYGGAAGQGATSHMPHAVRGYFENGGRRAFIARVVSIDEATPARTASSGDTLGPLVLSALGPGARGNNIVVAVTDPTSRDPADPTSPPPDRFRLVVACYATVPAPVAAGRFVDPSRRGAHADPHFRRPDHLEVYDDLSADPGDASYVLAALRGSSLVSGEWKGGVASASRPANTQFVRLANGDDGAPLTLADYRGSEEGPLARNGEQVHFATGLLGLERVDEVTLLAAPDEHDFGSDLSDEIIGQCERLSDRFAILSVAAGQREVGTIVNDRPTMFGAIYWPWIHVASPDGRDRILVPPVGHVAGVYARTDAEAGVHQAPANAPLVGALDLELEVTRGMQDTLNPRGVNVIRDFRPVGRGILVWGARTMSADPEWKYVNVRRLLIYLEQSIDRGTRWAVFEENGQPLWTRVRQNIENFLMTVWREGGLTGTKPEEAFFVKCDRSTMTRADIDNGRLVCAIGVAPLKPAEFVIFRIGQKTLGATPSA